MELMNVGELFKYLNSDTCEEFYQGLTYNNKNEIINKMMNNESFIKLAHENVSDDNIIRSKIDTKLGQLLKKNGRLVTSNELFLANLDGISNQLNKLSVAPGTNMVHVVPSVPEIVDQDGQASIRAPHVVLKPGSLGLQKVTIHWK